MALAMKSLPASWSNKNVVEKLRSDAADSFSRMIARAVAETGSNFQLWDGLRTRADQVALFKKHYRYTGRKHKTRSTDRWYNGTAWQWRGNVKVASPDLGSNHEGGVAIDLHPAPIQNWVQKNGKRFGWDWDEGKRNGEAWHFRYKPSLDQYKAEGWLDHAAVQKIVGADVDGKIGTGTVAKIKEWQKAHGLTADGKVGINTKKAMGLMGKDETPDVIPTPETVPDPPEVSGTPSTSDGFMYTYTREEWDTQGVSPKVHEFDHTVKGAYLHYPGSGNVTMANDTVEQTMARLRGYRKQHVEVNGWFDIGYLVAFDHRGYSYELRGAGNESGANGGTDSNNEATAYLLLVGNNEKPSSAMIDAVNGFLAQQKDRFEESEYIRGHRQSPDASTECPGPEVMSELQNGTFTYDGTPSTNTGDDVPSPSPTPNSDLPEGEDLLMALIAAPDFPLLRTDSHKCYYGPASGPSESVSGKNDNSLNPGDVVNGYSIGLKQYQTQLRERGYNIDADGKFGDETEAATKNLQRLAGIAQDGKIGPDAWHSAWLLPVQ